MKTNQTQVTSIELAQPLNTLAKTASKGDDVKVSKRSVSRMILGSMGLLIAGQMMVACQPKTGAGPAAPSSGAPSAPVLGGEGTGDSSGGDGINNKVFEAYSLDITKTSEWINHIAPIEKHLASLPKLRNIDANTLLSTVARTKRWYIAPVTLEQIEKKNLGVEFIRDPIQQLALQTTKSIWIDKEKYEDPRNTEHDRAYLQMHETMVALYLVRFLPAAEVCRQFTVDPSGCGSVDLAAMLGQPEPFRKLEKEDYERIRAMTNWMMVHAIESKSQKEVFVELYRQHFDPRFFKADPEAPRFEQERDGTSASASNDGPPYTMFNGSRATAMVNAKVLGRFPKFCNAKANGVVAAEACDINFDLHESAEGQIFKMHFSLLVDGKVEYYTMTQVMSLAADQTAGATKAYSSYRPLKLNDNSAYLLTLGVAVPAGKGPLQIGQNVYGVYVLWDQTGTSVKDVVLANLRIVNVAGIRSDRINGFDVTEEGFDVGTPNETEARNFVFTSDTPDSPEYRPVGGMAGRFSIIRSLEPVRKN